ncbi:MAG: nucleotide excision repair endonuclease [Deltaproteobacteria bacterium]|nr:nucleotide excision repair endonuclease [Deltaproteobacteria bacterium]
MPKKFRLFDLQDKSLDLKFPKIFFETIPSGPGTYSFKDKYDILLYIGKAKNLRKRLNSYRQVSLDRNSRKVLRMLHMTDKIEWITCESEKEALLQENKLLRSMRPAFNVLNTYPENYMFIWVRMQGRSLEMRLASYANENEAENFKSYGCFKNRSRTRLGFLAILRRLWLKAHPQSTELEIPSSLMKDKPPYRYVLDFDSEAEAKQSFKNLSQFLAGTSKKDILKIRSVDEGGKQNYSGFVRKIIEDDSEFIEDFFKYGPKRNRFLLKKFAQERLKIKKIIVEQNEIDDWLIL